MKKYTHNKETGKFASPNPEPMSKKVIGIRLPVSIEADVREIAGDDLVSWIREIIVKEVAKEKQKKSAEQTS